MPAMRFASLLVLAVLLMVPTTAAQDASTMSATTVSSLRPVATYSIVARDAKTGQMGVAVQSHWFSVGSVVSWAEAGVGAVATQSFIEPSYGPLGLTLMKSGRSAAEALDALVSTDDGEAVRQVAMVDANGVAAAHTGSLAISEAGHHVGEQFSVQANMMENDTVWPAMARAFESADGDLADRMLAALDAAQAEGGDIRGKQSAALLIVGPESTGRPWQDRVFDLRIEDHPEPLAELRRLVQLQRAYNAMNTGDHQMTTGDVEGAMQSYNRAMDLIPDEASNGEAPFWVGVTLASIGREGEAVPYLVRASEQDERWIELLGRLSASGLLPDDPELTERLQSAMR